jgi:hypothetical protein
MDGLMDNGYDSMAIHCVHMIGRLMNFEFLQMEWGKMRQIARSQWKGIILFEYLLGCAHTFTIAS